MASQNPSSVPVVLPGALSPILNYVNNNTLSWVPNTQAIATSNAFFGTAATPAVAANALGTPSNVLSVGSAASIPIGQVGLLTVLSRSVKNGGTPQANAYVYMTCNFISITGGLVNVFNPFSTDSSFSLVATGGNTVSIQSIANNTKSLQYVSVLIQTVPITSRLL